MDWQAQNAALLKLWGEAQAQMIDIWGRIAQQAQTPFYRGSSPLGATVFDASTDSIRQGIRAIAFDADPTAREAAEKLFVSQTSVVRLLEMTLRIWGSVYPVLQSGGDWRFALHEQMTWVKSQTLHAATQGLHTSGTYQQLWAAFLHESQSFGRPWLDDLDRPTPISPGAGELAWEAYQKTFGELVSLPTAIHTRAIDDGMRATFGAWIDMQQALYQYNAILADTWVSAFEQFIHDLIRLMESGEMLESVRDLLNRWSAVADNSFKQSFLTADYVRAQSRLVETVTQYRQRQRTVNERFMELFDLPTRAEIDEAHRRIYELRKEVKSLKREIAALRSQMNGASGSHESTPSDGGDT